MSNRQSVDFLSTASNQSLPTAAFGSARTNLPADSAAGNHGFIRETGIPQAVSWVSRNPPPRIESEVSIGPLLDGITLMMFVRRHRH